MSLHLPSIPEPRAPRGAKASGAAGALALGLLLAPFVGTHLGASPRAAVQDEDEAWSLTAEEAELIDHARRRGKPGQAVDDLEDVLLDLPDDPWALRLLARARYDLGEHEAALEAARAAFETVRRADEATPVELAAAARVLAELATELGRADEALEVLAAAGAAIRPDLEPRDAWVRGRARLAAGEREAAFEDWRAGAEAYGERSWESLLAQARCQRGLGQFRAAASTLVSADKVARDGLGPEPDVLVELGELYFEVYGEVQDPMSRAHSPEKLYEEALRLNARHEGALLGLFELNRFNWRLTRRSTEELLAEVFSARPRSLGGALARLRASLDDGDMKRARAALELARSVAPRRRDVRAEQAAVLWVDGDEAGSRALLEELVEQDGGDAMPERVVGEHLVALYRFAEGLPFLARSVERDPRDWRAWTGLGHAQANTGDEDAARTSLTTAVRLAEGRQNAWRDNMLLVLRRMEETLVEHVHEDHTFLWRPDAAAVLERYLVPFYEEAREELATRYGFTPGPVKIEVFRSWNDFSVRSTGFEGFPALGVCFGPVVTAVSPLAELRGGFSWARTSFHEFTHVVHLGLSHNRCPRWVTEGLATWEEGTKRPAWWRNLRREMLDARANDAITPVRDLNGAFRGPGVVFAYYQSGLLCQMLIEQHGFPPMVRLLEAFDRGADLDAALGEVFGRTPEELDVEFGRYVDRALEGLAIEPRWSRASTVKRRFRLTRQPPEAGDGGDPAELARWVDEWCKVAWGFHWARERVDAEEALRTARTGGELSPRGHFLAGELALGRGDAGAARESFERGFAAGGEDFRARVALASLLIQGDETEAATEHLLAAERAFPGFDEPHLSAELRLADLYTLQDRVEEAQAARLRWLAWNADDYDVRVEVAAWLVEQGRHEEAERLWREANEVDPFRRHLHLEWGKTLRTLGRHGEALREFEVGLLVPEELDLDAALVMAASEAHGALDDGLMELVTAGEPGAPSAEELMERWRSEEAQLHGLRALTLLDLGRGDEAPAALERALELDPECVPALEARARLE